MHNSVFTAMLWKNHFWFRKKKIQSIFFFKESSLSYLFIIWRTFFRHKEPFVKQKGYSDVKGSFWNHLGQKKVLLWHRDAHLFLWVYNKIILHFKITVSYCNIFSNVIYSCDEKAEFSTAITPVFSFTWFSEILLCSSGALITAAVLQWYIGA